MAPFERPTRLEEVYRRAIDKLIADYFHIPTTATLGELNARLVEFAQARNFLGRFAQTLASKMVTQVLVRNTRSWRVAASQASQGKAIYSMLRTSLVSGGLDHKIDALIQDNAKLIKSIPHNVASVVTRHIQERQMQGVRSDQIVREIAPKMREVKAYQIRRIARTEVAKADTAITMVRAEAIGLNWYQWESSEDARVRKSHRLMDQVLVNWTDAPAPETLVKEKSQGHYHAGNIYNCRCVALPIVSLDEIKFPVRAYFSGSIRRLSRNQFVMISGIGTKRIAA